MKVFISSVISGMEPYRKAAQSAVNSLGYQPILAEDFTASPSSARVACLEEVRQADCVVLLIGERYGAEQNAGISATHEEYEEAKARCPVFAFIQEGVDYEQRQKEFIQEIQDYSAGHYTNNFSDESTLREAITKALHNWAVNQASGSLNAQELLDRALSLIPNERNSMYGGKIELSVVLTGGPTQSLIRPSELEDSSFIDDLSQMASYDKDAVFTRKQGIEDQLKGHALILKQESGTLLIDEQGSISLNIQLQDFSLMPVIVEEEILEKITRALKFFEKVLQKIDAKECLSHVAIVVGVTGAGQSVWRTKKEHEAKPNSMTFSFQNRNKKVVHLSPPHRTRGVFRLEAHKIAEDLMVLLRREFKDQ